MTAAAAPIRVLELRTVRGTGGGPEKTILSGAEQSDRAKYAITVCYIRDRRDLTFHIDTRARALGIDYIEVCERHSFDHRIWPQLRTLVRERHIDIVHAHEYKTDLLALLLARYEAVIPLATAHGWTGHSWRERSIYYPADRRLLARFPRVIAVSSEIRATLVDAGAKPDRVVVVLNGIDPVAFTRNRSQRDAARTRFGLGSHDVAIGAVGRLEPQKGFTTLIRAFARISQEIREAKLVIAGEGSLRTALEQEITALKLEDRCHLVGHVDDVRSIHLALDLFVQASTYEGTPNAVLEAMALETPIVATNVGGTTELARDGVDALIVPANDEQALTDAMSVALTDKAAGVRRVAAARKRVEADLSFDARTRTVERIYDELAAEFSRSGDARAMRGPEVCATR
jgi:glycosyltransferase involved in cell wall biosynthesis